MRFVYLGPPDEPEAMGTIHALTGEWVKGEPRDIADPVHVEWLSRHPHWAALVDDAPPANGPDAPVMPARRGRPPKAR